MSLLVMSSIAAHMDLPRESPVRVALLKAFNEKQDEIVASGDLVRPTLPGVLQSVADGLVSAYSACKISAKADIYLHRISTIKQVEDGTLEARCKAPIVTEGNPVFAVSGDRVDSPGRPTKFIPEEPHV